jgi:hypothetical protein
VILPTKHIPSTKSLLGVASALLLPMSHPPTVTDLWDRVRADPDVGSFERFVLALDLLYLLGVIELVDGRLRRWD